MSAPRELATVELLGTLTYAQLRTFETTASAVRYAPNVRAADRIAEFSVREHGAYVLLRDRLRALTDLAESALDSHKRRVDAFFDTLPISGWRSACTYFAIGLPMAADFARAVAPVLEEETAEVVVSALADRGPFEAFAVEEVTAAIAQDAERREATRRLAAEITGSALTSFQAIVSDTDALLVLLEEQGGRDVGRDVLRMTAVSLLERHRRRMATVGLDTPD